MKTTLVIYLALIFTHSIAQTIDTKKIVGKWKWESYKDSSGKQHSASPIEDDILTLHSDSTYKFSIFYKNKTRTYVSIGKWKVLQNHTLYCHVDTQTKLIKFTLIVV
jgi:hypothetical protein